MLSGHPMLMVASVFNGLRAFALSDSWGPSVLITILSLAPFGTGIVRYSLFVHSHTHLIEPSDTIRIPHHRSPGEVACRRRMYPHLCLPYFSGARVRHVSLIFACVALMGLPSRSTYSTLERRQTNSPGFSYHPQSYMCYRF